MKKVIFISLIVLITGFFISPSYAKKPLVNKATSEKIVYQDKQTGLVFPASLGGLSYTTLIENEKQRSGTGFSLNYHNAEITAEVSIYNLGLTKITAPDITQAFETSKQAIYTLELSGKYKNIEEMKNQPAQISIGKNQFHYALFTYLTVGKMSYDSAIAEIFLTTYKNHFIKVLVISTKESQQKSVDNFMKALKLLLK